VSRQLRRLLLTTLACAALVLGLGLAPQSSLPTLPAAQAADLSQFDPGMIISDGVFYDAGTMSAADVQAFLNTKGANCRPAAGNTCLKDYSQSTISRPGDAYCAAYAGSGSESAASIIAKVAAACGINPQVLIVTLQKEQGLITSTTGKSAATYQKALGFGCPDTAPCNTEYYGFGNQVYLAAKQFKRYAANPTGYAHRAGVVNNVRFHPNAACGSSPVLIQNQATASLYNYTPYQPNAAALAAGYGTGDSCSAYGNRNFWNYFTDWFGSTAQRAPIGLIDGAVSPGVGTIRITGWAFDPDTTDSIDVHVYVDGKMTKAVKADRSRPDVGAIYGRGDKHGFDVTLQTTGGAHQVCVWGIDANGGPNPQLACVTVTVVNQQPAGNIDALTAPSIGTIRVQGWALDPDTTDSIWVHVYVDGKYLKQVKATATRQDIAAAYGKGAAHGFDTTFTATGGNHEVCVYGIDTSGGNNPKLACKTVTVNNKAPVGSIDAATSVTGKLRMQGWALDPDTTDSIWVHIYVDGKFATQVKATGTRTDVANAYGKGAAHGYDTTLDVGLGSHQVCVYAIDPTGGNNPQLGCRTVDVTNARPIGNIEALKTSTGQFSISGWALDPDTSDSIWVHVYVDGKMATQVKATGTRTDVANAYGKGAAHGYSTTVTASVGKHEVCVYGIDSWGGYNPLIQCKTVEVNGYPFGAVDAVTSPSAGTVRAQGWTIDPNTTDPILVHVYVDGAFAKQATADLNRTDLAAHYSSTRHGYDVSISGVAPGQHQVCVWGLDSWGPSAGGINVVLACRNVTVG